VCHRVTAAEFLKRPVVAQCRENNGFAFNWSPKDGETLVPLGKVCWQELHHIICAGSWNSCSVVCCVSE